MNIIIINNIDRVVFYLNFTSSFYNNSKMYTHNSLSLQSTLSLLLKIKRRGDKEKKRICYRRLNLKQKGKRFLRQNIIGIVSYMLMHSNCHSQCRVLAVTYLRLSQTVRITLIPRTLSLILLMQPVNGISLNI